MVLADSPVDLPIKDHFELVTFAVWRFIDMPGRAEEKEFDGKRLAVWRQARPCTADIKRVDSVPAVILGAAAW